MRFRKIALALFACLALGAFATSAAQAAEGEGWTIEGVGKLPFGTHQGVSCAKHGTSTLIFTSSLLGSEVELSAEGVDCLEKAGSKNPATIDNGYKVKEGEKEVEKGGPGHSEGVLTFTGVKVLKPAPGKCSVKNTGGELGEITTAALTDEVIMDTVIDKGPPEVKTVLPTVFDKFFPEVAGGAFVTLEFSGAECPLNEAAASVKGSACGEAVHTNEKGTAYEPNKTGELKVVQTLLFGAAQQSTGGCALTLGTKAAQIAGAVDNSLAGTNVGKAFGDD
ncbi:MAG TPA: hypothetical protein VJL81_01025 [Solirubrobacterales bacterium]|nr:hypothetical protein [Solirubrobacterales bacterium]